MRVVGAARDWSATFEVGSAQHLVVLGVCFGVIGVVCVLGRVLLAMDLKEGVGVPGAGRERGLRFVLAWGIGVSQLVINARRFMPGHWDLGDSLPLHLCRLSVWIAVWMLLTLDRRARALTLFWGLGLSAQVFVTPYLDVGHGDLSFWIYWLNHVQIVGVAVYDVVVLGYRPSWRDCRFAVVCGVVYAAVVAGLNALLGTNYSYLGSGSHDGTSLVDALGAYPWRMIWMGVGAIGIFVGITVVSKGAMWVRTKVMGKERPRFVDAHGVGGVDGSPTTLGP